MFSGLLETLVPVVDCLSFSSFDFDGNSKHMMIVVDSIYIYRFLWI